MELGRRWILIIILLMAVDRRAANGDPGQQVLIMYVGIPNEKVAA